MANLTEAPEAIAVSDDEVASSVTEADDEPEDVIDEGKELTESRIESDATMTATEKRHAKAELNKLQKLRKDWFKGHSDFVGPYIRHVDKIFKGKKNVRDVTKHVLAVMEKHDVRREDQFINYKAALALCIDAIPTKERASKPNPEYDVRILKAASFFLIPVVTVNRMLIEVNELLKAEKDATNSAEEAAGNGDAEMVDLDATPPALWTRPFSKETPWPEVIEDVSKSKEERFRAFVYALFRHVRPDQHHVLEWMIKVMVDPRSYDDIPSMATKNKVLEYFKVAEPSLHCSPFTLKGERFSDYVTTKRVVSWKRSDMDAPPVENPMVTYWEGVLKNWEEEKKREEEVKKQKQRVECGVEEEVGPRGIFGERMTVRQWNETKKMEEKGGSETTDQRSDDEEVEEDPFLADDIFDMLATEQGEGGVDLPSGWSEINSEDDTVEDRSIERESEDRDEVTVVVVEEEAEENSHNHAMEVVESRDAAGSDQSDNSEDTFFSAKTGEEKTEPPVVDPLMDVKKEEEEEEAADPVSLESFGTPDSTLVSMSSGNMDYQRDLSPSPPRKNDDAAVEERGARRNSKGMVQQSPLIQSKKSHKKKVEDMAADVKEEVEEETPKKSRDTGRLPQPSKEKEGKADVDEDEDKENKKEKEGKTLRRSGRFSQPSVRKQLSEEEIKKEPEDEEYEKDKETQVLRKSLKTPKTSQVVGPASLRKTHEKCEKKK